MIRLFIYLAVLSFPLTIWAQAPVITSFTPTTAASGATITITGTDFTGATDVSFGGTPAASFIIVDDFTITAVVDTGTSGDVSVTNAAGTDNFAGFIYDNVAPTVVIASTATDPTNVSPIPVTITFNESVTGFVVGNITVTYGTAGSFVPVSGTTYTADITPAGAGVVTVSVLANVAIDAATNGNTASNVLSRTYDNVAPTVTITSTATDPTNVSPIPVTITFSENVSGFILSDITVTNGTAGSFVPVSGTTFTANITPTAPGAVIVSVAANLANDAATNGNTASNVLSRTYDNVAPTVVITSTATDPTNVSPIPVTITFSESVSGFVVGDITVTNGTAGSFAGSGTTYTADITPTAAGVVTVSVAANVANDAATNGNTASNVLSRTYDNVAPTVVITSTATDPTNVSPIPVTITFSESVSGFILGDITVTNGTAGSFAGSGTTYTADITPTAAGVVTVSVAANVANDAATNGNTASNLLSRTYNNIAPTVVITTSATNPTNASPIPVTITFSEIVSGFILGDITVTNGTAGSFVPVSGTTYTADITPAGAGVVTVSVLANVAIDAATNGNIASNVLSRTYDNVAPTVVITSTATDPTNVSPIPVTITFSESVSGFVVGDITVTNGTAGSFVPVSGITYTASITPTAAGAVIVSVASNLANDAATNGNTASNVLSRTYDNVAPTVVITSTATDPTNVSPIPVTITFSESVSGFILGDITVTNGTAGSFAGSGTTYTADITPTAAGVVTVSVAANVANDAATNGNTASNLLSRTYNNIAPTVVITTSATNPTNASPIPVTITFSEIVSGFILGDITVTNGTAGSFVPVSGTTYTADITPAGAGVVTVSVLANVAIDAATNGNIASNVLSRTYDNVAPTVVITSTATDPTNVSPIPVTITFSESVSGFVVGDITVTNGTAGSFVPVSGITYTASITPTAAGAVIVSVASNLANDAATNGNTASNVLSRTYDNVAPTVVITSTATDPTNVSPIPVTITFSESVSGFILGDITVTNGTAGSFAGSGTTYTADITPTAAGVVTVSVAANVANDAATNGNTASNLLSRTYNNIAPTVVITTSATNPTNASPIPVTITFSEIVSGFDVGDITVTNGTAGSFGGSGTTYTASITPTAAGAVTVSVAANVAVDAATNGNTASNVLSRTYDNVAPTVVITSTATDPTNVSPIPVTITFSESVSGFILGDITITNGTAGSFAGSGTTYTASITPSAAGAVTVNVAANVAVDAATNGNTASLVAGFNYIPTTITSFTPASGAIGTSISITGTGFSTIPGNNIVTINGVTATIATSTATDITTSVPVGSTPGAGPIQVTVGSQTATSATNFSVLGSPTITSFSPASGAIGATVTITGTNFTGGPVVTFNGISAIVTSSSATSITTTVPVGSITGPINVTTSGVTLSSSTNFTVLASPTISDFNPDSGAISATVTISGTNFGTTPVVRFNGTLAAVSSSTAISITTTVPAGATSGTISVRTSGVTVTSSSSFTVLPTPSISGFSPSSGAVGATVTITGNNFSTSPSDNQITFNGVAATVTASSATSITTVIPVGGTTGIVALTLNGVTVNSASNFTVLSSPTITGFSPSSGAVSATITITGTNFNTTSSNNVVRFNGTLAVVTASTTTTITTTVPVGASTGAISVTTSGVTVVSASNFTVLPTPTISGFSPGSGAVGATVTISGNNFSTIPGNNVVKFLNNKTATVTASTANSITTTVPAGAVSGAITVTTSGVTVTSAGNFMVLPTPTITSFSPIGGIDGTTVIITGTNFNTTPANNIVEFNNVTAVVTAATPTKITTSVPVGAGSGPISVTVSGVTINSATNFIVFGTPSITGFSPNNGSYGAVVVISGSDFSSVPSANTVDFNGTTSVVTASTTTSITTSIPFGATTGPISVTVNGITGSSSSSFTIPTPIVSNFAPLSGAEGATVTITGSNFHTTPANNVVTFDGVTAVVTSSTPTSITTTVPSGATTGKITVSVGGLTGTSSSDFTVLPSPTITSFTPTSGAIGATVTISGTNFNTVSPDNNVIKFNITTAQTLTASATNLTTKVPTGATTGKVSVTTSNVTIVSAENFTVLPTPTITSFSPASAAAGAVVTITGTNFNTPLADNQVSFNGNVADIISSTSTSISAIVPANAVTGPISIIVNGVALTTVTNFTILPLPTFVGFTPSSGAVGATVIITGTNFNLTAANNKVKFNGVNAVVSIATSTSLTVNVPATAITGDITLTVSGVTLTSSTPFTILPTPTITGFDPGSGAVGAFVIISGTDFNTETQNIVKFNGVEAILITETTSTSITVQVPLGATTGKISVFTSGVTINSATNFKVLPTPFITSFSPASAVYGAFVNITGINFDSDESKITVAFNGTVATTIASNTTAIITKVPDGATTGPITVTLNGVTAKSATDFIVDYIDTSPPVFVENITPVEIAPSNNLRIQVKYEDLESGIASISVSYLNTTNRGQINPTIMLTKIGDYWEGEIPLESIGDLGVEYKFTATNGKGLSASSENFQARIVYNGLGLIIPYTSYGNNISNYRIFSVPLNLDKPSVENVFDELPPYDKSKWRISHYDNGTNANTELTSTSTITPGVGYWLLIKDNPGPILTTGPGKTVDVSQQPFTVSLKAGWNQIGNPYNFNLVWSELVASNPGLPISFRSFNGVIKNFENKTTLNKLEGGFVNVATNMDLVYPVKKNNGARVESPLTALRNSIDQDEWEVDFTVKQGDMANVISGVGMRLNASEGFDIYDGFSMPRFSEYLDVNHDKKLNQYHYSKDVIPTTDHHTWNFNVEASATDKSTSITWDNSYLGSNDMNLILFDEQMKVWIDMKQYNSYSFTSPARLKVLFGSENYIKKEVGLGNARILEVSPNPAKGPISIHLFLPEWQAKFPVHLELKSLTGNTLATIFSGELESGYQKFEWSGENSSIPLPSGVYLIQMRCNNSIQTVRVILLN